MDLVARWPLRTLFDVRDELLVAWDRDGYHDQLHLAEVLSAIAQLDRAGEHFDRIPVLLSAWFHDAVYDALPEAEERSAVWAEQALPNPPAAEVARLVRITAHHRVDGHDPNAAVLSDADLAILAAPAERYAAYRAGVRREYAAWSDHDFTAGRITLLGELMAAPRLFATDVGRRLWEVAARANVTAEITALCG